MAAKAAVQAVAPTSFREYLRYGTAADRSRGVGVLLFFLASSVVNTKSPGWTTSVLDHLDGGGGCGGFFDAAPPSFIFFIIACFFA